MGGQIFVEKLGEYKDAEISEQREAITGDYCYEECGNQSISARTDGDGAIANRLLGRVVKRGFEPS